jgi:hypothetical protein
MVFIFQVFLRVSKGLEVFSMPDGKDEPDF